MHGLFDKVIGGTIENLTVSGTIISKARDYVGGIVANATGNINNCTSRVDIVVNSERPGVGGIAGQGRNISNCYYEGNINISSFYTSVGGIAGYGYTVSNCYNQGDIEINEPTGSGLVDIGGIVGYGTEISNCCNDGNIKHIKLNNSYTQTSIGGIAGRGRAITDCSNTGVIDRKAEIKVISSTNNFILEIYIGGILGYGSEVSNCYNKAKILSNIYNEGTYVRNSIGGIVGNAADINNSYNEGEIRTKCISTSGELFSLQNYIGGIAGEYRGSLNNLYNTGNISNENIITGNKLNNNNYIGGISGNTNDDDASITNSYNIGDIKSNNEIKGEINENNNIVGAITARAFYKNNFYYPDTVRNSYYLNTIELQGDTLYESGTAKTQGEMQSKEFYNTLNTDGVWLYTNNKYPKLLMGIPANIVETTQLEIKNTLKQFEVTTDVSEINGIKGGKISGEDETPYEIISYGEKNTKEIIMIPELNYEITNITINGENINYKVNNDGSYTIPAGYFTNVQENKHIVVTYETNIKSTIITKVDETTNEPIANTKFVIYKITQDKEIIDFARDRAGNYVGMKNEFGIYIQSTDLNGKIEISLEPGNYKAVEIEPAEGYVLEEKEDDRTQYFNVGDITIKYIEDLLKLSYNVSSGTTYEGKVIQLSRTLDFNKELSYRNFEDTTTYGDYNGDGITEGIKDELTNETGSGFKPIGNTTGIFKGTFDGCGYEIKNIHINTTSWGGLFNEVSYGKISNLGIVGGKIKSTFPTGGITAKLTYGEISNCYNTAEISTTAPAGGIVGLYANNSIITNCYNLGTINSSYSIGGIIGQSATNTKIINCYNTGTISGTSTFAGIVVSATDCTINNCYYLNTTATQGIYNIQDEAGKLISKTETEMKSQEFVNLLNTNKEAVTDIELSNWVFKEDSYPSFETSTINNENNITITNKKAGKIIVHHYLKKSDGTKTNIKVVEDETKQGQIGAGYITSPKIDLKDVTLEKDLNNEYIIPKNASGEYKEEIQEVIYYYEPKDITLTINHYLEGTEIKLANEEVKTFKSEAIINDDGTYTITANGRFDVDTNENYNTIKSNYIFTRVISDIKENTSIEDYLEFEQDASVTYYYQQKDYQITTQVRKHTELREDEISKEIIEKQIEGGSITGEYVDIYKEEYGIKFVETVMNEDNSAQIIEIKPDINYVIKQIELISIKDDGNQTKSIIFAKDLNQDIDKNAEISYTKNEDGTITLSTFNKVTEDKHIIVEFEPIQGTVIVHHYIEGTGEEFGKEAIKVPSKNGNVIEDEIKQNYIGERYATKESENIATMYKLVSTSVKTSGEYIDGVIDVYYYYNYKEYAYRIEHYYEDKRTGEYIIDPNVTEIGNKVTYGEKVTIKDTNKKLKPNYTYERQENSPLTITEDIEKNVIKLYYGISDYKYSVRYFYDNIEDESKREEYTAQYGSIISTYKDKLIEGYEFEKVIPADSKDLLKASLSITEDNGKNIINVYYKSKKTATVKVQYLEEGTEKVLYKTEEGKEYEEINGYINDEYSTSPKEIPEYELIEEKYPSNSKGKMTEEEIVVKYYYRKIDIEVEEEISSSIGNIEDQNSNMPQTGQQRIVYLVLIVIIIGCVVILIYLKVKNKEKNNNK